MKKLIIQLIKFGIVGFIATVIDLVVLLFLKETLHIGVLIASTISFSTSLIANYILSTLFVFKGSENNKIKEFIIFFAFGVGGLLLNQFIMWFGTDVLNIYYLLVKASAMVFVPTYNFITRKIFLEKKTKKEEKL